jgi:hypothetical protein
MGDTAAPLRKAEGFGPQLGAGAALGGLAWWLGRPAGVWLGVSAPTWMAAAIAVPILHQLVAGIGWRAELFDRWFTRRFGAVGLRVFGLAFFPLFALRPLVVLAVGMADAGSLWTPGAASLVAAGVVAAPAVWTFVSVARFFGARRALGVDHFDRDFAEPFVRRGAFAVVPNAMYVFGFLALWAIAIATGSRAALAAAAFQHAFIWAHYRWVERPDMQVIYEGRPVAGEGHGASS